ncbi:MAG: hypothetical protein KGS61_08485 [Verrucomicrobia bacterium]|nr:hypothetical protein [Verrucomicrobiota bacterium]
MQDGFLETVQLDFSGTFARLCHRRWSDMLASMEERAAPTIRDLYPTLGDEGLRQAEDNLAQYIALALRVYERVSSDPVAYAQFRALLAKNRTVQSSTRGE